MVRVRLAVLWLGAVLAALVGTDASAQNSASAQTESSVQTDVLTQPGASGMIFERVSPLSETFSEERIPSVSGTPQVRTGYRVEVRDMVWTAPNDAFQVRARAYCPIDAQGKVPVVLFSHGLGASVERFEYLGDRWASRGIASIFLSHPGSDESHWRGKLRPMNELKEIYKKYWSARDRALMIRFTLDRLTEMAGQSGTVAERLDLTRVGVAGNDLGALAALLVAGQLPPDNGPSLVDGRIKAVAALSPPVYCSPDRSQIVYGGVQVPFLSFAGTNDDGVVGSTKAYQRRIPFDGMSGNPRYHVTLEGGDHMVYSGHLRSGKKAGDAVYQRSIRDVSTLFWSAYLLDDGDARRALNEADPARIALAGRMERNLR